MQKYREMMLIKLKLGKGVILMVLLKHVKISNFQRAAITTVNFSAKDQRRKEG